MGTAWSQFFPPKAKWTAANVPDLSGKIYLVTGGYDGIGYETTKELLKHNGKVYVAGRSQSKAEEAMMRLKTETGKDVAGFIPLDLSDLPSVKAAADQYMSLETTLNVLIANAGVMRSPVEMVTKQGYDLQIGTNVLGHWYLTILLLPALRTAAIEGTGTARVVTLSSSVSDHAGPVNWNVFANNVAERTQFATANLYSQSKLLNVVATLELAKRYGDTGIVFSSLNPGNIRTGLARYMTPLQQKIVARLVYPPDMGAITSLYAATAPETATLQGGYYDPWARQRPPAKLAQDPMTGQRLWRWMDAAIKNQDGAQSP